MKPTKQQVILEYKDDEVEFGDGWELIEDDDWTQDYKCQHSSPVYRHIASGTYWMFSLSRSGSPFTDWYYDDPEVTEVTPRTETVTITKTVWDAVAE